MSRRVLSAVGCCGLVLALAGWANAGHPRPTLVAPTDVPPHVVSSPPGPHRNPGCSPWQGYGFGVPTYNWGYFGAQYRPICISHTGYCGDYSQWGYRRGY